MPNPILGVIYHWLGGLAAGSFYVPYKGVKRWSWETYWLVGGFFSWIVCPWVMVLFLTESPIDVLGQQSLSTLWWTYFFGAMWGLGGLTFGLSMRYLGMSLGMGVALGYCAAFGTLLPPVFKGFLPAIPVPETILQIVGNPAGQITLAGVAICIFGIGIAALAGLTKEKQMSEASKKKAIAEFSYRKGIVVATFSGIMSACFAFALTAGNGIAETAIQMGTDPIWSGLPKLIVVLFGGFTTNCVWCLILSFKNKTGYQYFATVSREDQAMKEPVQGFSGSPNRVPLFANYCLSALAGITWYFQFFFYTMGETQMGEFGFASWTLHMASIIIFSTLWGFVFKEWKGSSRKAHLLIFGGVATLILSTIVIGYGTYMKAGPIVGH